VSDKSILKTERVLAESFVHKMGDEVQVRTTATVLFGVELDLSEWDGILNCE
jgi:hypothetical protein